MTDYYPIRWLMTRGFDHRAIAHMLRMNGSYIRDIINGKKPLTAKIKPRLDEVYDIFVHSPLCKATNIFESYYHARLPDSRITLAHLMSHHTLDRPAIESLMAQLAQSVSLTQPRWKQLDLKFELR